MTTTARHTGRIIVPIDPATERAPALEWAMHEALARGLGLDVFVPWSPPPWGLTEGELRPMDSPAYPVASWSALEAAVDALGARRSRLDARAVRVARHDAVDLIERSRSAAMLVVGTRRRGLAGLRAGPVSRQCTLYAQCPVVVVPADWSPTAQLATVVAGVDGSPSSARALAWAANTVAAHSASLDIVHARHENPPGDPTGLEFVFDRGAIAKESQTLVGEMADRVLTHRARRTSIRFLPVDDYPADALCAAAGTADLLVVGSHGRGCFGRRPLGSVAEQCLQRTLARSQ